MSESRATLSDVPAFAAVKAAFETISELPFCSGTVPLDANNATLFYRSKDGARVVNFLDATEEQLSSLANACKQATFGVEQKDVLDESYRKAGKMDPADFAIQFSPVTSGIVDTVRNALLQHSADQTPIQVELYKLNVYGPGSFFKTHVDTPRSDKMFGSLVVVLPTVHEGGSLLFRHRGQEHTLDTAQAVASQGSPHVAFVAFYSDIEHEVSVVSLGYRVTLTYNLYFSEQPSPNTALGIIPEQDPLRQMKKALSALLDDPQFLPKGGLIGFGLSHKYPFNPRTTDLDDLLPRLKGSDADVLNICNSLALDVSLKALYSDKDRWRQPSRYCLLDSFANLDADLEIEEVIVDYLKQKYDGTLVYNVSNPATGSSEGEPIVWIKPLSDSNSFQQPFVAYGNEASLGYAWSDVCLVATIGAEEEGSSESE